MSRVRGDAEDEARRTAHRLSAVASTRNWSRMCSVRAPTARRTPISRVRSVTDTSMMFMMPMPPTSSDTEATLRSRFIITALAFFEASAISLRLRTVKFVVLARRNAVALAQSLRNLPFDPGEGVGRRGRDDDHVDRAQDLRAEDAPLGGQERHQDDVVLILAPRRLPLAGEDADHSKGNVLHAMIAPIGSSPAAKS